jgi:phage shock protein A
MNEEVKGRTRLERLQQRITELERQRKALQARENAKQRKARARRLIQIGALTLKYFNISYEIEPGEFEALLRKALGLSPKTGATESKE